jgi:hypothetical protein
VVAAAEVVDEHLFDGLVVGNEHVADGVSASEVADFLGVDGLAISWSEKRQRIVILWHHLRSTVLIHVHARAMQNAADC